MQVIIKIKKKHNAQTHYIVKKLTFLNGNLMKRPLRKSSFKNSNQY